MFKNVMDMSREELMLYEEMKKLIYCHSTQGQQELHSDPYEGYDDCGSEEEDKHYVIL